MRTSLWPTGLVGRVGIVLFAAVVLELLGSTFMFEQAEIVSSDDAQAKRIAAQLDGAARVLSATSPAQRWPGRPVGWSGLVVAALIAIPPASSARRPRSTVSRAAS